MGKPHPLLLQTEGFCLILELLRVVECQGFFLQVAQIVYCYEILLNLPRPQEPTSMMVNLWDASHIASNTILLNCL